MNNKQAGLTWRIQNGFRLLSIAGAVLFSGTVFSQSENWTQVNLSVTDNQVAPAYKTFAQSTEVLSEQAMKICQNLDGASLSNLQQLFHDAMDAWQGVQHLQFGPVTYFNWNFRLQYWPDDKGIGGKQLTAFIADQDQSALLADSFSRQSVGIQGFPALERLLFAESGLEALQNNAYQCQTMQTIAANLSDMASGIEQRWENEFRAIVANADERGFFESAEDATIDFLKALVETIPRINTQKLLPVLGQSYTLSRVKKAESWRSQRSLRNIKINLATLSRFLNGPNEQSSNASDNSALVLSDVFHETDVIKINATFAAITTTIEKLPDSIESAMSSESGYLTLQGLSSQLDELEEALESALKNTDLYLGFNSLDGD